MKTIEINGQLRCTACGYEFTDQDIRENLDNNTGVLCGCGAHYSIELFWEFEDDEFTFTDYYNCIAISESEIDDMISWGKNPGYFDFEKFGIDPSDWINEEEEEEEEEFEFEIILYNHILPEHTEYNDYEEIFKIITGGQIIDKRI